MDTATLKTTIKKFLDAHHKMVLTVLDRDGHPNSSLVLFAADHDLNIYFGTRKSFGKYSALKADPRVAIAVVQEDVDPLQVVDMQGRAEEISAKDTPELLAWFTNKNTSTYYVKGADDFVMFKVKPHAVRWLDATSGELQFYDLPASAL